MDRKNKALLRRRATSLAELTAQIMAGMNYQTACGNFLDAFYHARPEDRQSFIDVEPPDHICACVPPVNVAYLAAVAESLANRYGLEKPAWVEKDRYFCPTAEFSGWGESEISGRLKALYMEESPAEFARRNIFVSANVLTRY